MNLDAGVEKLDRKVWTVTGAENILNFYISLTNRLKKDVKCCYDYSGPILIRKTQPIWENNLKVDKRGIKIRFLTEIREENLQYCKKMLEEIKHIEMRHMDGVKGNFALHDDREYFLPFFVGKPEEPESRNALYCTQKEMVEAHLFMFENLWRQAIPAQLRIKELEEGVKPTFTKILRDAHEIQKLAFEIVSSAKEEILVLIFEHTTIGNMFLVKENVNEIMESIKDLVIQNRVRVRILTSSYMQEQIERLVGKQRIWVNSKEMGRRKEETDADVKGLPKLEEEQGKFEIHLIDAIEERQHLQANISILVVDSKIVLVEESKTNDKVNNNSNSYLTMATYSNSESTLLAYSSIFETLWAQTELKRESFR